MLSALVGGGVSVLPQQASAQSDEIRQAKERFSEGRKLYEAGDFSAAAAAFQEAYKLSGRAELLYNIGEAHKNAGNHREAERYLQQYLEDLPAAPNSAEVVQAIVELQRRIAAELATVEVTATIAGRAVYIDDEEEPRCWTPCSVTVSPGDRVFRLTGELAKPFEQTLTLGPTEVAKLDVTLQPLREAGMLVVATDRQAGVLVVTDDSGVGRRESLPLASPLDLDVGRYDLTVEAARNARWSGEVTVTSGETTELFVPMQGLVDARKRGGPRRIAAYTLWGGGVAAGVGGVLLGLGARNSYDAAQSAVADRGAADPDLVNQGRAQQTGANVMFAAATGMLLTGTALFVWDLLSADVDPKP